MRMGPLAARRFSDRGVRAGLGTDLSSYPRADILLQARLLLQAERMFYTSPAEIDTVLVEGQALKRNGVLVHSDLAGLQRRVAGAGTLRSASARHPAKRMGRNVRVAQHLTRPWLPDSNAIDSSL